MVINKIQTSPNQKESSSLTDQKLFIRRPDITPEMRLDLSIAGLGRQYRDCTIFKVWTKSSLKKKGKTIDKFIEMVDNWMVF